MYREENKKKNRLIKGLIAVILILLLLLIKQCSAPNKTAVIEVNNKDIQEIQDGQIRIRMNPSITVKHETMQDMEFCNYNEDRLMKLNIKINGASVYESQFIKPGEILKADIIDTGMLKEGDNDAIAEIHTYSISEAPIGQTNVKIVLINHV